MCGSSQLDESNEKMSKVVVRRANTKDPVLVRVWVWIVQIYAQLGVAIPLISLCGLLSALTDNNQLGFRISTI